MKTSRLSAQRALRRRPPTRQAGATIVEFAIISPIAILLVMGIIQLGLMFSAKQLLNEATFVAARAGAEQNAQKSAMSTALTTAMIPFYQNTLYTDPATRLADAYGSASSDLSPLNLDIAVLNPNADVFSDFGLTDATTNQTYIPNDSLEYRDHSWTGPTTGLTIQDANALKIKVTYAYELKVPLMQSVFKSVMCGFDTGVNAFGRGGTVPSPDCVQYYNRGRVPIVAYATVQMQSPAWPTN
jgi:Flp pilus assembly protein TadG